MKFLGQGFHKLQHDQETHTQTHRQREAEIETYVTEHITTAEFCDGDECHHVGK